FIIGFALFCGLYEYGRVMNLRPMPMHLWRQTDCLSITLNYYKDRATFAYPVIHSQIADNGASGHSAGEFPILYWTVAQIWKVTGQSEMAYRLFGLLLHFTAMYLFYRMLYRLLGSDLWSIGIPLLLFTSPVLVYYNISFLTDVPAFDLTMIGWYFFVRHAQEQRKRFWAFSMACFAMGALLKVSAGISLVAVTGIYALATVLPSLVGELKRVFPRMVFGWVTLCLAVASVLAWYIHAEAYNDLHNGRYTFNDVWPLWKMTSLQIDKALEYGMDILVFQIFDTSVWLVIGVSLLLLFLHGRSIPRAVILLNVGLLSGAILYTVFWFNAVDQHDYYFINPLIPILAPLITAIWWLKKDRPDLFHAPWLRWAFLFLLGYNVAYAATNITMRSNPNSYYNRQDLLPTYHCQEPVYWNEVGTQGLRDYHGLDEYMDDLGVGREDLIMSLDDGTINASLYFMDRPGFTRHGYDYMDPATFEKCIALGAKYLIYTNSWWPEKEHVHRYLKKPIGQHRNALIFDVRDLSNN
ncbi:MAG: glycosyltransferase family 39 protein, partial [Bacteroidota bacterium]|nr:glycosyltransferase family 39 protein [Bacteroidota bacterium]